MTNADDRAKLEKTKAALDKLYKLKLEILQRGDVPPTALNAEIEQLRAEYDLIPKDRVEDFTTTPQAMQQTRERLVQETQLYRDIERQTTDALAAGAHLTESERQSLRTKLAMIRSENPTAVLQAAQGAGAAVEVAGVFTYAPGGRAGFTWSDQDQARYGITSEAAGLPVRDREFQAANARTSEAAADALGPDATPEERAAAGAAGSGLNNPEKLPLGAVLQRLSEMAAGERLALQRKLYAAGYYSAEAKDIRWGDYDMATADALGDLLVDANRSDPSLSKTWAAFLDDQVAQQESGLGPDGEPLPAEPVQVPLLTVEGVRSSYSATFRKMVGRDPSEVEVGEFVNAYNAEAKANPPKTKIEKGEGNVEFVTTEGGVDPAEFAEETITENADYANYQAVAYYMPVLERALGAVGGMSSGGLGE